VFYSLILSHYYFIIRLKKKEIFSLFRFVKKYDYIMANSKFCEAITKTYKLGSENRLCCSEESCSLNPPRCPISVHSNLIRCHQIGNNLEACQRKGNLNDKSAQEVCQEANTNKLFCLRIHEKVVASYPSPPHEWTISRF